MIYKDDSADVSKDDPNCQRKYMCRTCYKNAIKAREEVSHRKKNKNSKKIFKHAMPLYNENVSVYRGEPGDVDEAVLQVGPANRLQTHKLTCMLVLQMFHQQKKYIL